LYYALIQITIIFSFKDRGALNVLQLLPLDKKKLGVVIASIGNEAAAICYYASKMNIPIIVIMPNNVPIAKLQKCHNLGAKVLVQGGNLMESQRYARAIARDKGLTYING
jgi:threonine dehydratase